MHVYEALPAAVVVIEKWQGDRSRFAQIEILRASVAKPAGWIAGTFFCPPQNVPRSFGATGEKYDSEIRPRSLPPAAFPIVPNPVLICFVSEKLGFDTVRARRVDWLRRIIDLEEHVKEASSLLKLKVAIRLLEVGSGGKCQSSVAVVSQDLDSRFVADNERMHDDFGRGHRVLKSRRRDFRNQCTGRSIGLVGMN